jgi:hypothetical protein
VDYVPSTSSKEPVFGKLSTLYQWHQDDPVDSWEQRRNDRIDTNWQHNRNPFIDYPEFAARMPSISGVVLETGPELAVAPASVDMGQISLLTGASFKIALVNTGTQTLNISSIVSTNPLFSVSQTSLSIDQETDSVLTVSIDGQSSEGTYNTIIQISSDDSDESYVEIPVTVVVSGETSLIDGEQRVNSFYLAQNFPNPFNPKTTIRFQLPERCSVVLSVFNATGQCIKSSIYDTFGPGQQKLEFSGASMASGIYYYKLTATSESGQVYTDTRKMVFIQ